MQTIKNVIQLHELSTRSGIAARTEQSMTCRTASTLTTPTSSTSADIEKHKKRIHNLFLRLAAIYGHVWRSLYKSDEFLAFTKNEWLEGLKKFEDTAIDKTLLTCRDQWEYPPSLPQLIEGCKQVTNKNKGFYNNNQPANKAKPEIAMMYLTQLKTILNIKN